jgi:small subunit ribosomal protein S20
MPIKKSAKKYIKVSGRKMERNKSVKGIFRSAVKKTRQLASAGNIPEAKKWLAISIKSLDKAAQKKVIKKNTAARLKSRLNKLVKNTSSKK